jgi:hypothetical protein
MDVMTQDPANHAHAHASTALAAAIDLRYVHLKVGNVDLATALARNFHGSMMQVLETSVAAK